MSPDHDFDAMERRVSGGGAGGLRIIAWVIVLPIALAILSIWVWGWVAGR